MEGHDDRGLVDRFAKRAMDVCVSGAALVFLSPLLLFIGGMVRTSSPGPALYRSRRLGRHASTFEILKFRTMRLDAPDVRNADGSTYSHSADPRLTTVGRWLRRTSLDELPQLWNVMRGDMSLVGPRPDLPDQIAYYAPTDRRRLALRPGMTGLAQISGRNDLTWEQRRALDVQYVASRSFLRDLGILIRTLPAVLLGRGVFVAMREQPHDEPRHH